MPKYEVIKDSYLDQPDKRSETGYAPRYIKAGAKISYDGWPGAGLEPLDAEAKRRCAIVAEHRKNGIKLPDTVADYDKAQAKAAKAEKQPKPDKAA